MSLYRASVKKTGKVYVLIFPDTGITESGLTIEEAIDKARKKLIDNSVTPDITEGEFYIDIDHRVTSGGRRPIQMPPNLSELLRTETIANIAKQHDVSISTVNRWKKKLKKIQKE